MPLVRQAVAGELADATQVVYVSPLKALSNDIQRNLEQPLGGIAAELAAHGPAGAADSRAGAHRRYAAGRARRDAPPPPHILVTTPESLYLLLTSESGRAHAGHDAHGDRR